jgi:hypothetical protein
MNTTFVVKVLPSLNKLPKLSTECLIFESVEKQARVSLIKNLCFKIKVLYLKGTMIGSLKLIHGYEQIFGSLTVYSLIHNLQDLQQISGWFLSHSKINVKI